jgi:hypothetical protein
MTPTTEATGCAVAALHNPRAPGSLLALGLAFVVFGARRRRRQRG